MEQDKAIKLHIKRSAVNKNRCIALKEWERLYACKISDCSVSSRIELKQGGQGVVVTTWDIYIYWPRGGMINFCLLDFKNYNVYLECMVTVCMLQSY